MTILILTTSNTAVKYDPIIDIAVENCKNVTPDRVHEAKKVAHKIFLIEQQFDVPKSLRGMVLAAACLESGFNPLAKGDRRFSRDKKTPKAIGVLQLWPWWEHGRWGYKINRKDPAQSAKAWMTHISKQIPSIRRKCKPRTKKLLWVQAWVQAIRAPKASGRCRERPKHLRYLKKMRKIERQHKTKNSHS